MEGGYAMQVINIDLSQNEIRKIACIPDLHMRDVDFKTLQGFKATGESFIRDTLTPKLLEAGVTDIIFLGDIVDKGYRNVGPAYSHMSLMEMMKERFTGNIFATVLGNHFFIEMQNNPELYWIQPHNLYKPIEYIYRTNQLISTPDIIKIGTTQISLFHYHPRNKIYHHDILSDVKMHIGLYHDDCTLPNSVRGFGLNNEDLLQYYDNIDIAIHGHIHVPHDVTYLPIGTKQIPIIVPGSCTLTSSDEKEFHTSVKIPILSVTNISCSLSYVTLSLGVNNIRILKRKKEPQSEIKKRVNELRVKTQRADVQVDTIANYIRSNNLPHHYISYIKQAAEHSLSVSSLAKQVRDMGTYTIDIKDIED